MFKWPRAKKGVLERKPGILAMRTLVKAGGGGDEQRREGGCQPGDCGRGENAPLGALTARCACMCVTDWWPPPLLLGQSITLHRLLPARAPHPLSPTLSQACTESLRLFPPHLPSLGRTRPASGSGHSLLPPAISLFPLLAVGFSNKSLAHLILSCHLHLRGPELAE